VERQSGGSLLRRSGRYGYEGWKPPHSTGAQTAPRCEGSGATGTGRRKVVSPVPRLRDGLRGVAPYPWPDRPGLLACRP